MVNGFFLLSYTGFGHPGGTTNIGSVPLKEIMTTKSPDKTAVILILKKAIYRTVNVSTK
jgi:hypothetical protein